jgi:hypothetical protein
MKLFKSIITRATIFYFFKIFVLAIIIIGCENHDINEEVVENSASIENILDIPDGFDFSTHKRINLTINDTEEKIKYDIYIHSRLSYSDEETDLDFNEILFENNVYKHIISGTTNDLKINHSVNLPKDKKSICIRRKSNNGYEFSIIEINQNNIIYNYSPNEITNNNSLMTTVIPATLSQDMIITGNAIGSVGLNTNGFDLEVSGDLLLSGFIDLSNSNSTISANAI